MASEDREIQDAQIDREESEDQKGSQDQKATDPIEELYSFKTDEGDYSFVQYRVYRASDRYYIIAKEYDAHDEELLPDDYDDEKDNEERLDRAIRDGEGYNTMTKLIESFAPVSWSDADHDELREKLRERFRSLLAGEAPEVGEQTVMLVVCGSLPVMLFNLGKKTGEEWAEGTATVEDP